LYKISSMTLYIKNMVCARCILAVKEILKEIHIKPVNIELGEVTLNDEMSNEEKHTFNIKLEKLGFELISDSNQKIIEKIKSILISQIREYKTQTSTYSEFLSQKLNKDYSYLSKLFSTMEGVTIENYIILQKIEKVKELLSYDELNLSEISYKLGYSSVAHLSTQFKKVTGQTPSQFKAQKKKIRKSLDNII
jgi:AraC family transcriptional regulator